MEANTFAILAVFGVPVAGVLLLFAAHWIIPKGIWFSFTAQTIVTGFFVALIATPFLVIYTDAQGEYFENSGELVGEAFALPGGVEVNRQRDRTVRLGDCWRNAVNWRSDVLFSSAEDFDSWYGAEGYRAGLVDQIVGYYGIEPGSLSIADGALDLRERDPKYELVDDHKAYSQNVRILEFYEPFVCTAIERDEDGAITLRPCDPVALTPDMGNAGRIIINPDRRDRTLEGKIYYAEGPHYCTNPVRRAVNDALGLPHPENREPNTQMSGVLPL